MLIGAELGRRSYRVPVSVRQKIDQLISDSIDEVEDHPPGSPEPGKEMAPDFAVEVRELAAQVRELTTQVATLTTIIKRLRED